MVRIVWNPIGELILTDYELAHYNTLRLKAGLDTKFDNIERHDEHLIETIEIYESASIIDISCDEYSVIQENNGERVIPNPGFLLTNIFKELHNNYYNNNNNNNNCEELLLEAYDVVLNTRSLVTK